MINTIGYLDERRDFAKERLDILRVKINEISELKDRTSDLCIYASGSYGRLEASKHSDIDLFFLHVGSKSKNKISEIQKTLIDSELIRITRELGFPEFSDDGRYLEIHYVDDVLEFLGGPLDDYSNSFTARMLLLLESQPVFGDSLFDKFIEKIISSYFRDYHDHVKDFRPIFLVNDIKRYWNTLCLNYEHRRNRPAKEPSIKIKNHVKNLKLKFSRMLTCYSTILLLSKSRELFQPNAFTELVHFTPLKRLKIAIDYINGSKDLFSEILEDYAWFLKISGNESAKVEEWISNSDNRIDAFKRAENFTKNIFDILWKIVPDKETQRYLVI